MMYATNSTGTCAAVLTLFCDLKPLLTESGHSLEHLVGTDMRLEVTRVPEFTKQLPQSTN